MYPQQFLIFCFLIIYGFALPTQTNLKPRIINGSKSSPQPWVVQFTMIDGDDIFQHCAGSLIAPRWVLTAAHCFIEADGSGKVNEDLNAIQVSIGSNEFNKGESYKIKNLIQTPEKFNTDQKLYVINDILLVELDSDVPANIATSINLPSDEKTIIDLQPAQTYGWGATETSMSSETLLTTDGYIVPQKVCYDSFADPKKICFNSTEHHSTICHGDSGGPLTIQNNGEPVLVGIVSYGDCDIQQLFTRVSAYLTWIKKNIV